MNLRQRVFQPGRSTADFSADDAGPMAAHRVIFLVHPFLHKVVFATPLRFHRNSSYARLAKPMTDRLIEVRGIAPEDSEARFDQVADPAARSPVIALAAV